MPSTHFSLHFHLVFSTKNRLTDDQQGLACKPAWQSGYLGVTVSPSQIAQVKNYVLNQVEHHRRQTFEEEYLEMLKLSSIEYDDRFVC